MFNSNQNQQSISNERMLKIEGVSPLKKVKTVINQTRPLSFQFRKRFASPKNSKTELKQEIPQSKQTTPVTNFTSTSLHCITKDFKLHRLTIKSSTIKMLNKSMDSIQEQISTENKSQSTPLTPPVMRRHSSSVVGSYQSRESALIQSVENSSCKQKSRNQSQSSSHSNLFIPEFDFGRGFLNIPKEGIKGNILQSELNSQRCSLFNNEEFCKDKYSDCPCHQQQQQNHNVTQHEFIEDLLTYNAEIFDDESYNTKQSQAPISFCTLKPRRVEARNKRYQSVVIETMSAVDQYREQDAYMLEQVVQYPRRHRQSSVKSEKNVHKHSFAHEIGSPLPDNQILLPFQRQRKQTQNSNTISNNKQGTASNKKSYQHRRQFSESCLPQELLDNTDNCLSAQMYKNMTIHIFSQINYIKKIQGKPDLSDEQFINFKFKKPGFKKLLIFDLDQTLIHSPRDQHDQEEAEKVENLNLDQESLKDADFVKFIPETYVSLIDPENGDTYQTGFSMRPYALECLQQANLNFEVAIYTAANDWYANPIIDKLDPTGELIQHRYFRDQCTFVDHPGTDNKRIQFFVKDLRIFKDVDPKNILIIDDNIYSFAFNLENGIPIIPFYGQKDDKEMIKVIKYLQRIQDKDDLRIPNDQVFQLKKILRSNISKSFIKYYNLEDVPEQQNQEDQISSHEEEEEENSTSSNGIADVLITVERTSISGLDEDENNSLDRQSLDIKEDKSDILNQLRESLILQQRSIMAQDIEFNIFSSPDDDLKNDFFLSINERINDSNLLSGGNDYEGSYMDQYRREKSFHTKPTKKLVFQHATTINLSQGRQNSPPKKTVSSINLSQGLLHYVPQLQSLQNFEDIPSIIQPPKRQTGKGSKRYSINATKNSRPTSVTSKSIESDLDKWQSAYQKACQKGSIYDFIRLSKLGKQNNKLALACLGQRGDEKSKNKRLYMQKHQSYPCQSNVSQDQQQLMRSKRLQSEDYNQPPQTYINSKINQQLIE
eukprot:403342466